MAGYNPASTVVGLEGTRRALRAISKEAGREFDKEAKRTAIKVRDRARETMPKRTGKSAKTIGVSSTYKGVAVRSSNPAVRQHEYGAKVWLNRGLPYARPRGSGMGSARTPKGSVELRQRPASPGRSGQPRVVNQAQYLIPRKRMLRSAANQFAPQLQRDTERLMERLAAKNGF